MLTIPEEIKNIFRTSKSKKIKIRLRFYDKDIKMIYPEDTLFPSDNLFPIDQEPCYIIENDQIVSESMVITESICEQEELVFGQCSAAQFEITVVDVLQDFTGYEFAATMEVAGYELALGFYRVNSFVRQADRRKKKITAYNRMLNFQKDVAAWYQGLVFPLSLKQFRDSLCDYMGMKQLPVTLPLDNMVVTKTIEPDQLSGRKVLQAICEINGCFGQVDKTGRLKYVFLCDTGLFPSETLFPDDNLFPAEMQGETVPYYKRSETLYEDYLVSSIEQVQIRQEEGDIGASFGDGSGCYVIQGNFLVFGKSTIELTQIAATVYDKISGKIYRPSTIVGPGLPWVEVGDGIICCTSDDVIETYCLKRTMKGIQALTDTYESKGKSERTEKYGIKDQIIQLEGKAAVIKKSVEEVSVRVTDLKAYTEAQFKITADSIVAEVKRAQQAEAALSIRADQIELSVKNTKDELSSKITQTASEIRSEVKNTKDNLQSQIIQTVDQIATEVKRAQGAENTLSSKITQTATQIRTEITNTKNSLQSSITQNAQQIALKVSKGNISSELSVESGKVTISGNRLIVNSTNFKLDGNGNATFTGNISGGTINIGNGNFTVNASGKAVLKGAEFNGVINGATINGAILVTGDAIVARNTLEGHNCYLDEITSNTIMCAHDLYAGEIYLQGGWWDGWSLTEEIRMLHNAVFGGS